MGAVLQMSRGLFPFIEKVWADGGYNHERVTQAAGITVEEIVSKITGQTGFVVLPGHRVVERFFAWINRNRRIARNAEATFRVRRSIPLRRRCHVHDPQTGTISMGFATDS